MLEHLFGSQTRIKLLQYFLNNQAGKFYVRELTRIIGSQINAVRRELQNLERMGLIMVCEGGDGSGASRKCKFYTVNPEFVILPELKTIIEKSQFMVEKSFADQLQKVGNVDYLVLTGSFVGNNDIPTDLLIVGNIDVGKLKRRVKQFENVLQREVNYTLMDRDEFDYRRNVADRFLYGILDNKKVVIIDNVLNQPATDVLDTAETES